MSRVERTAIFTEKLFELEEALENGSKKEFVEKLKEHSLSLHNCSIGDSYAKKIGGGNERKTNKNQTIDIGSY